MANLCPAGTQPVQIGGEICCGVPNAGPYIDRAGGQPLSHAGSTAGYYAQEGVKGVVRR